MAGFAGAFVDREVEPRAENAFDRERVQRDAMQQTQPMLDQQFGGGGGGGGYGQDQGYDQNQGGGYGGDQQGGQQQSNW